MVHASCSKNLRCVWVLHVWAILEKMFMLLLYTHILYKGGSNGVEWNVYYTPFNVVPLKKFNEHYTYHINDACNALLIGSSCGLFLFFFYQINWAIV